MGLPFTSRYVFEIYIPIISVPPADERDRKIIERRLIDGITFERLAEEFDMSVRQIKNIVYKSQEQLSRHL